MTKFSFKGRALMFLSILFVGALIFTSFGGVAPVQAATAPVAPVGDGTSVSVGFTIYKDGSGYTCAKNSATGHVDYRSTDSRWVIQKTIDKMSGGNLLIKAGTYSLNKCVYTNKVSIIGEGNATHLDATSGNRGSVIRVCDDYWTLDYRYMSARPNGITIANLQIDGNRASGGGHMQGIGFIDALNSRVVKVYVHDIHGGQGIYMSNSQHCSISRSVIDNIGGNTASDYGSGIAFGTGSRTHVASSYISIDNVRITRASMSSIDLEPANHVSITNCVFRDATTWKGYRTPVITEYNVAGYALCDYITVSGCTVYGAFNEFVILSPSSHSVVKNNHVTLTTGTCISIYSINSHSNTITGNVIKSYCNTPIKLVSCTSSTVSGNTLIRL